MQGIIPTPRLAIRHPAVTTRQLLPRDSALIHPEILELDAPHRPPTVSFLVLSREITPSEMEAGILSLPICHATWDFPDPDAFYDVLQQVVDLLEPGHRKPGALMTAASASEALGICIIQIKNEFGHSMDFIRRAFRGAHFPGTQLETFPLAAFLPPTAIHLNKPWSKGMKSYIAKKILNCLSTLKLLAIQAAIYGKCPGCPPQPTRSDANAWDDRPNGTSRGLRLNGNLDDPDNTTANTYNTMNKFIIKLFNQHKTLTLLIIISRLFAIIFSLCIHPLATGTPPRK